ncbi:hypothetical protein [Micromonospora sp. NPDC004551]|uniref:LppU/SCO3897 family protein n=1 Tax=Micromonospora sp. NPDC004551 TaxID=3154284 RepID=UPI0033AA2E24
MTAPFVNPPQVPPAPQTAPQPAAWPAGTLTCRCCGSVPAIKGTLHGHQGFLIFMRLLTQRGPFCRSCGIAVCRDMSAKTLWQGWWGILSMVITPVVLIGNLITRVRLGRLAEPVPGAPGTPATPGKPVFRRAAAFGLVIPVAIALAIGWSISTDPSYADVGDCVSATGTDTDPSVSVVDCGDATATYVVVGKVEDTTDDARCEQFSGAVAAYTEERDSQKFLLCLGQNR